MRQLALILIWGCGDRVLADADATIWGEQDDSEIGFDVVGDVDVNGDGYPDVLVSDMMYDDRGRAYVFYGPVSGSQGADAADGIIAGEDGDALGEGIAGVTDLNGDGRDEIFVGVPRYERVADHGERDREQAGWPVATDDVDGDGAPDLLISAHDPIDEIDDAGGVYLFFGAP